MQRLHPPHLWLVLLAVTAVGGALRVAAGTGGLWLDEAWSAVFARDVRTPGGVFASIHHDNNHHLNTLWLQLVGFDAPPLLQRALSIACGTAAVVVAGLIGARRSLAAAGITALLFAVSPVLVTYGAEARGYAPMVLALLTAVLLCERWLEKADAPPPAVALAVTCLLGTLAQLTMVVGVAALTAAALLRLWSTRGARAGIVLAVRLMGAAVLTTAAAGALVVAVLPGSGGFHFGKLQPFTRPDFVAGLHDAIEYTLGIGPHPVLPPLVLVTTAAALAFVPALRSRSPFYALAILGWPLAVAILQLGNAGIPRYYLLSSVALLLLIGEGLALAVAARPAWRTTALAALAVLLAGSAWRDAALIANRRADPAAALRLIARDPGTLSVERPRATAVVEAAAAAERVPLLLTECGDWLFVDRDGDEPFPPIPRLCGRDYVLAAGASPTGLSGTHWRLYRAQ